jgi:hypothetical protein
MSGKTERLKPRMSKPYQAIVFPDCMPAFFV